MKRNAGASSDGGGVMGKESCFTEQGKSSKNMLD